MAKRVDHRRDGVYIRPDRAGFWGSYTDERGRRRQCKLNAETYAEAKKEVTVKAERAKQIRESGVPQPSPDALSTVLKDFLKYQKARQTHESYLRTKQIVESYIEPFFGNIPMSGITRATVSSYASERAEHASPGTVLKELGVVKAMLRYLLEEKQAIAFNPAARLKAPRKAPSGRTRWLQPLEVKAILKECPDWLRGIVGVAVFTGMRRSEILGLRWRNVDLHNGVLQLSETKNGHARTVHLNQHAIEAIRAQRSKDSKLGDLVFPAGLTEGVSADNVSKAFKAVVNRLKLEDVHFHDLRRTAGSLMRNQGFDGYTVAQVLGHRDMRAAKIYQQLSDERQSAAVRSLDFILTTEPKQLGSGD
jgi:integrase